jgi:hypothetical protein
MPFTAEQFLNVFETYNRAVTSFQWLFWILTLTAIMLAGRPARWSGRAISTILGVMWLWTAIVYHFYFFSAINPAAFIFAVIFIIQGSVFLLCSDKLRFRITSNFQSIFGIAILIYSLVAYPMLGDYFGHVYPRAPGFGTPCPTTIFTFGMLMFLDRRPPVYVYLIPLLWSVLGVTAVYLFGVYEDLGMLAAGVIGSLLLFRKGSGNID